MMNKWMGWLLVSAGGILALASISMYPLRFVAWPVGMTLLALGSGLVGKRLQQKSWRTAMNAENVFLLLLSLSSTVQAWQADELYSLENQGIDRALSYEVLLLFAHLAFSLYLLLHDSTRPGQHALAAAIVYTSLLYLPSFETAEAGLPFLAPMLLAVVVTWLAGAGQAESRLPGKQVSRLQVTLAAFMLLGLVAVGFSHAPGESLAWWLKLAALVLLALQVPRLLPDWRSWQHMLGLTLLVAYFPILWLGLEKYGQLALAFGLQAALSYRLGLVELGRANLIARELMIGWPLLFVFWRLAHPAWLRCLLGIALVLGVAVFALCQSAGGLVGVGVMLLFSAGMKYRAKLTGRRGLGIAVVVVSLLVAGMIGGARIASQLNVGSFNGRLFQFRAGLMQIRDYPLFGVGPGVYHLKAQYLPEIGWVTDARLTIDDPLLPVQWYQDSARLHAHNLWLELGVGLGIPALLCFILFLWELLAVGIQSWKRLSGEQRLMVGGSLVGIVAALGWGILDVMQASPPFFSTSVWVLVGLTLTTVKFSLPQVEEASPSHDLTSWLRRYELALATGVGLALFVIGSGNFYFRQAAFHLRQQDWQAAEIDLVPALKWDPLNPSYRQLQAETLLNLERYNDAETVYRQALNLKRDFPPYLRQLGWLAWFHGDLAGAEGYFRQALRVDPHAAWSSDLYASLGLALAAEGREAEAIDALAQDIRFDPTNATLLHWVSSLNESGEIDVTLDAAYLEPIATSPELRKRIAAQLGQAGSIPETLAPPSTASSISMRRVFQRMEADLSSPHTQNDKLVIMASLAYAAQLRDMADEAERYAKQYLQAVPESSFGYQEMAEIAVQAGDLSAAEDWLRQALLVSPNNLSLANFLLQVKLDQHDLAGAKEILQAINSNHGQDWLQPDFIDADFLRSLYRYYQDSGDLEKSRLVLKRLVMVQENPDDYLALAILYQSTAEPDPAATYCWQAYDLLGNIFQPYAGRIWTIATCIAQSTETEDQIQDELDQKQSDFINLLFMGHVTRIRNKSDLSVNNYQQATAARPDEGAPYYFLGELYSSIGNVEEAEQAYQRAVELDNRESLALLALGRLYDGAGNSQEALSAYRSAVARTPSWDEAQLALGNFYLKSGDFNQADIHFKLARQISGGFNPARRYEFAPNLASARLTDNITEGYLKAGIYEIEGVRKYSIFMHPISAASYQLTLPEKTAGSALWLEFSLGMLPDSWSQAGDGVNFSIDIKSASQTVEIYSTYIDPKHNPQDRRWHTAGVDLSAYAGQEVTLTFRTDGGDAGDLRFDWACWGEPFLVVK